MSSLRSWVIGLVGLAVLVGLALLVLEVRRGPAPEVDEAKLKAAQAAYRRTAAEVREPPRLPEVAPVLPPRSEPSPPPATEPERREPLRGRVEPAVARLGQARSVRLGGAGEGGGLKGRMDSVNRLYDRADYEGAREAALEVLAEHPKQPRMLRVVVSSSCIMGDAEVATRYFGRLERERDRKQMARRCARYGIELSE